MDATSESEGQKEISKWMEQVQAARNSLDEARKASLLLDDPAILDRAWEHYFRAGIPSIGNSAPEHMSLKE